MARSSWILGVGVVSQDVWRKGHLSLVKERYWACSFKTSRRLQCFGRWYVYDELISNANEDAISVPTQACCTERSRPQLLLSSVHPTVHSVLEEIESKSYDRQISGTNHNTAVIRPMNLNLIMLSRQSSFSD